MDKKISLILFMFMISMAVPLFGGYTLSLFEIKLISVPVHSLLETAGAMMAFTLSILIIVTGAKKRFFSHFHYTSLALISMGIFDIFHAAVLPGELFVWLHSLAVFFGGLLFLSVWFEEKTVSKKFYYVAPLSIVFISLFISVVSIIYEEFIPPMLINGRFSEFSIFSFEKI